MDQARVNSIPLFASLSKKARKQVAQCADEIDLPEGRELIRQGDFAYEFFVIEEGTAEVIHDGEKLAELGPGDFLGEMGLLEHSTRNASVVAKTPITAVVMTGRDFRRIEREFPEVAEQIRPAVERRAEALVDRLPAA